MLFILSAPVVADENTDMALAIAGDAEAGERVFKKCKACHMVGAEAQNKVGPVLNNIIGRPIAAQEEFNYSKTLTEMGEAGEVWSFAALDAFFAKPREFAQGTKMSFAGLRKEADRQNVIAYLAGFSE